MPPIQRIWPVSGTDLERGVLKHLPQYEDCLGIEPGKEFEETRSQLAEIGRIRAGRRQPIHMDVLGQRLATQVADGLISDKEARDKIAEAELENRRLSEAESALQSRLINNAISELEKAFMLEAEQSFTSLQARFGEHLATFEESLATIDGIEDDRAAILADSHVTEAWGSASRAASMMKRLWALASDLRRDGLLAVHPKDAEQRAFRHLDYSYKHPDRLPYRPPRRLGDTTPAEHPILRMMSHLPAAPALLSADGLVALEREARERAKFEDDEADREKRLDRDRRRGEPTGGALFA